MSKIALKARIGFSLTAVGAIGAAAMLSYGWLLSRHVSLTEKGS